MCTCVGIVVGTLGVAGYLQAAEKVRAMTQAAGKKTYTLLMGKPSPVKLANFPEVDVFVLIADAQVCSLCATQSQSQSLLQRDVQGRAAASISQSFVGILQFQ